MRFLKKTIAIRENSDIVHGMNNKRGATSGVPVYQLEQFQELIAKLFQCCRERIQYQCDRFELPDAELRCLLLFKQERYLTASGISLKMDVVKSRVTKILEGLVKKGYIQRVIDPEDHRVILLSLTTAGQKKIAEIDEFLMEVHQTVLNRVHPDQRTALLSNLELLKTAMQSVKDMMT